MSQVSEIRRPQDVALGDYVTDGMRLAEVVWVEATGLTLVDARTEEKFDVTIAEARRWRVVHWREACDGVA